MTNAVAFKLYFTELTQTVTSGITDAKPNPENVADDDEAIRLLEARSSILLSGDSPASIADKRMLSLQIELEARRRRRLVKKENLLPSMPLVVGTDGVIDLTGD